MPSAICGPWSGSRYAGTPERWTEPAAGCLLPAARRVRERVGGGSRPGPVVRGDNATTRDMMTWAERFGLHGKAKIPRRALPAEMPGTPPKAFSGALSTCLPLVTPLDDPR
ncbi:hypothetical protein JCM4814A_88100 [Streptomyces phaeofaciens JCM 4814]|uniref:Uncharacterized protein n=1 Tax=Streptomyces phaeofaciens TaxID=68254 RepID=A0A918HBD7_9ACTN|nr:hypothetical protein GCM10010226_29450 [Streptomyces phaeofaciens]